MLSTVAPLLFFPGIFYHIRACKEGTAYAVRLLLFFFNDQCGSLFLFCDRCHILATIGPQKCQLNKHCETLISLKVHSHGKYRM